MIKKALMGVLTFLFVSIILTGCVKMPYDGNNFIEMPKDFEQNIEEIEYELPELEAIIEIEEEIISLENETSNLDEYNKNDISKSEELTQFDIDQLEEELPEGVFKRFIINEQEIIDLKVSAMDPDGNKLLYQFSSPLNGNGRWETKRGDAGEYITEIVVSDGELETSAKILIVVNSINKEPVMDKIENIVIKEGETITLKPFATDGNEDPIEFTYSGFMNSPTKKIGYDTIKCNEGIYDCMQTFVVRITAADGFSEVYQDVGITVINTNRAPALEPIEDIVINEKGIVEIIPEAIDPDGNNIKVSFTPPLDNNGRWETKRGDAGEYMVYVTVSDGDLSTSEKLMVTVNSINKDPVLVKSMDSIVVYETETIILKPYAMDPNNDTITFEFSGWMDSYKYETTYDDAGKYVVTITAKDPYGGYDSMDINITVIDVNRPPVILGIYN